VSPEQLATAEAAYRAASAEADRLKDERNALVLQALNAGWTHAAISEATGLSRGRIGQIAQTRN
jgi:DNA-directed RNA polymerase specialized sigma24 family protein